MSIIADKVGITDMATLEAPPQFGAELKACFILKRVRESLELMLTGLRYRTRSNQSAVGYVCASHSGPETKTKCMDRYRMVYHG